MLDGMDWSEIEDAPPGDEVRWLMRGWMTPQKRRRRLLALRRYHESELAWAEARVEQMKGALRQIDDYMADHAMLGGKQ